MDDKKAYVRMLQKINSDKDVSVFANYKWKGEPSEQKGKRQVLQGLCRSCMAGECKTLVYVEDGVVVKIEGNPEAPPNFGVLCGKGISELMNFYNPYRVKTPVIRTNPEKGLNIDPKWKEVNLAAQVPGWQRFAAADQWLKAAAGRAGATDEQLRENFRAFMGQQAKTAPQDQAARPSLGPWGRGRRGGRALPGHSIRVSKGRPSRIPAIVDPPA